MIKLIVSSFQEAVFVLDDNKVAVLLEDLISKFKTFGEGLDGLRSELKEFREETDIKLCDLQNQIIRLSVDNRQEHQQLIQMVKELDNEVQVEIKRVK